VRFHVGSDHGGVHLRAELTAALREWGHEIVSEAGPTRADEKADYPDVARTVGRRVLDDPGSFGLLVCGTGQGVAMAANKLPGIRAGAVGDPFSARMLREHNDANVICLGERVLGTELAKTVLEAFLSASFAGGRHQRRVDDIEAE
jgi:ribose 5-phosphate isomerase B